MILDTVVKIVMVGFVALFIIILIVKRFCYFKPSYDFTYPQAKFEDIMEGNVHSWYLKGVNNKIILFCHGNAGNISHRQDKLIELNKLGYSVLIFDYSGFGRSKGVPTEQMCYHNASMYMEFLLSKFPKENIVIYGESLGAAVAMYTARRYNVTNVIIESGLPGIKHLFKTWYPYLSFLGFIFWEFDTNSYIKGFKGRVFCLHCLNDETIPFSLTQTIRDNSTRVIPMEGNHNNPKIPWKEIDNFITKK